MNMPMLQESAEATVARIMAERAVNPDLQIGLDELTKSAPDYQEAEDYFDDDVPEVFASTRLRRAIERTGVDYKVNFARIPVTAVVNRLKITSTLCPGNEDATAWIERQWENNQLDLNAPNIHLRTGEYGDAYVMLWPVDREDDEGDDDAFDAPEESRVSSTSAGRETDVEITYNSPLCVRIIYDPENQRRKLFAIKKWQLPGDRTRVDLVYRDRLEKYITKGGTKTPSAADFYVFRDDDEDEWPYENPYNEIPVFHFRTDAGPYGTPDHKNFYGTQQILRKLIVTHMGTVDYQGFQQRYALTAEGSDTSEHAADGDDEFTFADDATGTTRNRGGSARAQYNADPGDLWFMRGVKEVGQFDEADPQVFIAPASFYLRLGALANEFPVRLFDAVTGQQPSGASYIQHDGPFDDRCKLRVLSVKASWREMWTCALKMAGFGNVPVVVNFAPVQRVSGLEAWKTITLQIEAGVPVRQAFAEAGYTNEQIVAWLGEEDNDVPARLSLLQQIGLVLQSFAGVTAFELIPADQVKELIAAVLEVVPELGKSRAAAET